MTNDRDNNDDGTPRNHRIQNDPALAAQGLGALHLSSDDILATAAACYSVAKSGHEDFKAGRRRNDGMDADAIAQLYQIGATWLRVLGGPGLTAQAEKMEAAAAEVIRHAAMGDLDRIRKTASTH